MILNFSHRLVALRKANNLSQEEVAKRLFVTRQAVSKWECGESYPDIENLFALAKLYNVTIDDIVDNSKELPLHKPEEEQSVIFSDILVEQDDKKLERKRLFLEMLRFVFLASAICTGLCAAIHSIFQQFIQNALLIYGVISIIVPMLFLWKYHHKIAPCYYMLFINMPCLAFLAYFTWKQVTPFNSLAWLCFLSLPLYYAAAISIILKYRDKKESMDKHEHSFLADEEEENPKHHRA